MRKKSDNKVKLNEPNISSSFVSEVKQIIYLGRQKAYASINSAMMETYWNIGKRIVLEEQKGDKRAKYGKRLIQELSKELTGTFGKGFSPRYLAYFRLFYTVIPDIKILQTRLQNLTWSHILKGNKRLFATKYKIYLPTEEQLREEIEKQKQIFKIQHAKAKDGFEK